MIQKYRRIVAVLLVALMALQPFTAIRATEYEHLIYETLDTGAHITGLTAPPTDGVLVIPDTIDELPVTEIANRAFFQSDITEVTFDNSITTIGDYAFAGNSLDTLTLPTTLTTIGAHAFRDNVITTLNTANVQSIGESAFVNNRLTDLTFGAGGDSGVETRRRSCYCTLRESCPWCIYRART